jgi:hypothetical protein
MWREKWNVALTLPNQPGILDTEKNGGRVESGGG